MGITAKTQKHMMRHLYAGMLQSVTLLKRGNDQAEGTVTAFRLHGLRQARIYKSGQPINGNMAVGSNVTWHIPMAELERVGVAYLNVLDRIVDKTGAYWQPETGQMIRTQLLKTHVCYECVRVDPPSSPAN